MQQQKQLTGLQKWCKDNLERNKDYLEALLGTPAWPRRAMAGAKGQRVYSSFARMLEDFEEASFVDCYIATHSELDKQEFTISLIFIDIDSKNDIQKAISDALMLVARLEKSYNVRPHVQVSGSKGAHVLIPIDPITFDTLEGAKSFLHFVQFYLYRNVDPAITGDIARLFRSPFSINSKAIDTPHRGVCRPILEWNGKRLDATPFLELFKLNEETKTKFARKQLARVASVNGKFEDYGLRMLDLVDISKMRKSGNEYYGAHPIHGSTTGRDFWINPEKNVWYCFRHRIGGGPLHFLAIKYGLVNEDDFAVTPERPEPPKFELRGELYKKVLEKAVEEGLLPQEVLKKKGGGK
jgi:hypothetical protein